MKIIKNKDSKKNKGRSFVSKSLEDTKNIAKKFVEDATHILGMRESAIVVAMYGNLGSGKTTFVKAVAYEFGIKNTITSPTFVIEKIYKLENQNFDNLIHIDAYRLKSGEELKALGWNDIFKNYKNIIFIEWSENVKDIIPNNAKKIKFNFIDENTREINISEKRKVKNAK